MSSLELCPISEHLDSKEIKLLMRELEDADISAPDLAEDAEPIPLEQDFDEDVFVDFWDQLDANDVACDVYLPVEFEDVLEVEGRRFGSAHALLIVLANIKEDMFLDDDEGDEDEGVEDIDDELDEFDDYVEDGDDDYEADDDDGAVEVKDQQMRRVWLALQRGAKLAIAQRLALFVHG